MTPRSALARRLRRRIQRSLVAIPVVYLAAAIVLGDLSPWLDRRYDPPLAADVDIDTARAVLSATGTGMIAFTGLVVSSVLVVVQFAAGQYSPRLVLWFRRDAVVKHAIGSFLAAFLFSLVALRELHGGDDVSPDVTVAISLLLLIAATVFFLVLLERVMDRLRPRTLYGAVAREGMRAARAIYPLRLAEHGDSRPARLGRARAADGAPRRLARRGRLVRARRAGPRGRRERRDAGDRPRRRRVRGPRAPAAARPRGVDASDAALARAVDVSDERTITQDPAFALRIIVDTAIRALSPAVNDPTTAVQALDVLEVMVLELAGHDLDQSVARGPDGAVRLAWHSPGWADLVELAFEEIRTYGASSSVQIARRMRALLEDLREATPAVRHAVLDDQLARLDAAVQVAYPEGSPERAAALGADRIGLGLSR